MSYTRLILSPDHDKPDADRYLTPPWVLRWFLRSSGWVPCGDVIWDPGAAGVRGWSIGLEVGRHHGMPFCLTDIAPASPGVTKGDFFTTSPPKGRVVTHITNPPFGVLGKWLQKALSESAEAILLVPVNWLFNERHGRRIEHMTDLWVPSRRMAFGLDDAAIETRRHALREGRQTILHPNCTSVTGWGFGTTGEAHGWARWVPGYDGPARLHRPTYPTHEDLIMPGDRQISLFGGANGSGD